MTTQNAFAAAFDSYVCEGESIVAEIDGFTVTATIHLDDDTTPPWEREDGHGAVTNWTSRPKAPGERVLSSGRRESRFYDFAGAVQIARRDAWGVPGGRLEGESVGAYAVRAVERDFEALKAWCADEWFYCGVALQVSRAGVDLTGEFDVALWGIEANYLDSGNDHLTENANELLGEALKVARLALARLAAA